MPEIPPPFSDAEYAGRLAKTRAAMASAGIEVLFCADPSNMAWLTGYDGWSFYVHQGVIVGPDGPPVLWARAMDAVGAKLTCYMGEDFCVPYPDHYVMSTERHPMDHLALTIAERGWAGMRLGVEMENYYYSAKAHQVLVRATGAEPVDATALVNWCRAVKSPAEIALMRKAAKVVGQMHARILEIVEPGVRKCDVAAEIMATGIRGAEMDGVPYGGDYPAIVPLMPSGVQAAAAHLTWDDSPFLKDQGTFFEIAGCVRRYHTPLCRTVYLGTPPDHFRRAEAAVIEGIAAGIEIARPGNTAGDVARAFYAILKREGIEREGRCGYPIGLSYPPDWGERTFSIRPEDTTPLEAGMTFHFMPAIWQADWGLEITEPLLVHEDGPAEALGDVPRELFVKP